MKKLLILFLSLIILSVSGCQSGHLFIKSQDPYLEKVSDNPENYPYYLYIPQDGLKQDGNLKPLLVFLHGSGERSNELNPRVLSHGPLKPIYTVDMDTDNLNPNMVAELNVHVRDSYVLVPVVQVSQYWDVNKLDALIESITEKYNVDQNRIYLTGLSMGGYGVWDYVSTYTEKIAAMVPICGGYASSSPLSPELSSKPIWAFHSFSDLLVKRWETQDRIFNFLMGTNITEPFYDKNQFLTDTSYPHKDNISSNYASDIYTLSWKDGSVLGWSQGSSKPKGSLNYTIYPSRFHDSWTTTYYNENMWEWLYSKHLK